MTKNFYSGKEKAVNPEISTHQMNARRIHVRRIEARRISEGIMGVSDLWLLVKKIAVGIAVTVVPLAILTGGLWMTQNKLKNEALKKNIQPTVTHSVEVSHAD